jgi:hypothetical protein
MEKGTNSDTSALQAENWILRKLYQKYLRSFEVCFCRTMGKISCIDVRNEELLQKSQEEGEFPTTNKKKEFNWIGHILRTDCLLKP